VHRCGPGEAAQVIADAVAARGLRRVGVPRGFPAEWSALLRGAVPGDPPLDVAALDALDGVVTTCAVAIAETGTIVLDTGPGQGSRAFTLVPDYHLAVVRAAQIVAAVPDAVAALDPTRPLTWISGPSATSDIELSRVEGVHGPRTLDIVIVSDQDVHRTERHFVRFYQYVANYRGRSGLRGGSGALQDPGSTAKPLTTAISGGRRDRCSRYRRSPAAITESGRGHHGPFGPRMVLWSMPAGEEFDARPVRAFRPGRGVHVDEAVWPASVPAMAQLLREGLELPTGLTVLVGENGSGKSTVVESLAEAYGLNPQGGSVQGQLFRVRDSEPGAGYGLTVVRGLRAPWSYFLRADTMSQLYTYLEQNPGRRTERLHELSHGEGFLEILRTRVNQEGFYLMDEPDAPLSFVASLGLAALLHDLAAGGSQVVVATHSPVIAAIPGAHLIELGPWGMRPSAWEDLSLVIAWRDFMRDPRSYFRHLFDEL
jgi:predicted ATPase